MDDGEPLEGGVANAGAVVRIGSTVRRPWQATTPYTHAVLARLAEVAPGVAPVPLGRDEQGREVLEWIDGDVAVPPYPAWSVTDSYLASVGVLLRQVHDALAGWRPAPGLVCSDELADPAGGELTVHADVCPENVVARNGRAVALLDWDFVAPGRPVWDVVSTARLCVPFVSPVRRSAEYAGQDVLARLVLLVEAYGLDRSARRQVGAVLAERRAVGERFVRRRAARGEPAFVARWSGPEAERSHHHEQRWLVEVQADVAEALTG